MDEIKGSVLKVSRKGGNFWKGVLLASVPADDRFYILKDLVASDHLLPQDLLKDAKSVLVFFVAFKEELLSMNMDGELPHRSWGIAYEATNQLIEEFLQSIKEGLQQYGYRSVTTPPTHNFDKERLISLWSHKHLGYIANLGTFGLNCQLITPLGCGGRLGSLVTEAPLPETPKWSKGELCLGKRGVSCQKCIQICPVSALELNGIKRSLCFKRLCYNIERSPALTGLQPTTHVCGKCVVVCPAKCNSIPDGIMYLEFD